MTTDFERAGLATEHLAVEGRQWIVTVDFEAFESRDIELWTAAMDEWGRLWGQCGWPCAVFIALEDVARLRSNDERGYTQLLGAIHAMHAAGCVFYPHNHQVFDDDTGERSREIGPGDDRAHGYSKRTSMYYDVVHRQRLEFRKWVDHLERSYARFLRDASIPVPGARVFRPGGWDHGSSADELADYVDSLTAAGYTFDSSATAGQYGTASWQVGAEFGRNLYRLRGGIVEVAPTGSLTCGLPPMSAKWLHELVGVGQDTSLALRPRCGVFTTVLHFDHLFHGWSSTGRMAPFAMRDPAVAMKRVRALFSRLRWLRIGLRVDRMVEFQQVTVADAVPPRVVGSAPASASRRR